VLRKRRDGLQITAGASALTGRDGGAVAVPHGEAVERGLLATSAARLRQRAGGRGDDLRPGRHVRLLAPTPPDQRPSQQPGTVAAAGACAIPRVLGHNRTATWAGSSHTKPRDWNAVLAPLAAPS
jgi:hypothetical protein